MTGSPRVFVAVSGVLLVLVVAGVLSLASCEPFWEQSQVNHEVAVDEVTLAFRWLVHDSIDTKEPAEVLSAGLKGAKDTAKLYTHESLDDVQPRFAGDISQQESALRAALNKLFNRVPNPEDRERVKLAAIDEMARLFDNPHTSFVPSALWRERGASAGVAYGMSTVKTGEGDLVWDVLPDSPAESAGIVPGDVITQFDSQATLPTGRLDLVNPLQPVNVSVWRGGEQLSLRLPPDPAAVPFIDWALFPGRIAYVRFYSFWPNEPASADAWTTLFRTAIGTLRAFRPTGWILDLRNNPGGSAPLAALVGATFGMNSPFISHTFDGRVEAVVPPKVETVTAGEPVVVLINGSTASAAEALAQVMSEQGRARLIGQQTRGAIAASTIYEIEGGVLFIATGRARVGARQLDLNGIGVSPSMEVVLDPNKLRFVTGVGFLRGNVAPDDRTEFDSQLQAAIDYLKLK